MKEEMIALQIVRWTNGRNKAQKQPNYAVQNPPKAQQFVKVVISDS